MTIPNENPYAPPRADSSPRRAAQDDARSAVTPRMRSYARFDLFVTFLIGLADVGLIGYVAWLWRQPLPPPPDDGFNFEGVVRVVLLFYTVLVNIFLLAPVILLGFLGNYSLLRGNIRGAVLLWIRCSIAGLAYIFFVMAFVRSVAPLGAVIPLLIFTLLVVWWFAQSILIHGERRALAEQEPEFWEGNRPA